MKASKAIFPANPNSAFAQLLNAGIGDPKKLERGAIVVGQYEGNGLVFVAGLKADAILHTSDPKDEVAVGFTAPCIVTHNGDEAEEDAFGDENKVVVSFVRAGAWIAAKSAFESKTRVAVKVTGQQRKGGMLVGLKVLYGSLNGFILRKHLRGPRQADELVGRELNLEVDQCDPALNKLTFNLDAVHQELEDARLAELAIKVKSFKVNTIITGKVAKWLDCGALIDLGDGFCGLLHHSEIVATKTAGKGISKLEPGTVVTVTVLGTDEVRGRVQLSQKLAARRAFVLSEPVNREFEGTVVSVQQYGAFVEVAPGVSGLLHKSRTPSIPKLGDVVKVRCLTCDDIGERIDLGSC